MMLSIFQPDQHLINAFVWTLIHSLWQFGLIALLMSVLLKLYQNSAPAIKYNIAMGSLVLSFFTAVATFLYFYYDQASDELPTLVNEMTYYVPAAASQNNLLLSLTSWIDQYQLPVFYTWVMGVVLFGLKFVISVGYVEFLSGTSTPIYCQDTYKAFRRVSMHYNVSTNITIGESKYVKSPMILGFLKPIILFPIGVINQLDTSETEAILAHELAHFVRKDLYINIIQNLMEAVLYYHPAIWWISANIKLERESCCDDLAVGYMGDNIHYARTLVKMQEIFHTGSPTLALNFSKKESFFSNRIKRILNMTQTRNYLKEKIITSIVLVAALMFFTKDMTGTSDYPTENKNKTAITSIKKVNITVDTLPDNKVTISIRQKTDDRDVKLSMEDGKITELEIDGKKIDEKDYDQYEDIIAEVKPRNSTNSKNNSFYFNGDDDGPFLFGYDGIDMDSIMKDLNISNFDLRKELNGFKFDTDVLRKNLEQGWFKLDDIQNLKDHELNREEMENKKGEMNKMKELSRKNFEISREQMERMMDELGKMPNMLGDIMKIDKEKWNQMKDEMSKMKFDFEGMDSMNFNFNFPEIGDWPSAPDVKIYRYDGKDQDFNFNRDDAEREHDFERAPKNFSDVIGKTLNKDGLLIPDKDNKVELTGKYLKINGDKQPENIFQKYKRTFEEVSGTTLEKNSKLQFNFIGKESNRKLRVF
jgi:beta-lactamase regulating signal transducer with metallopeptidase domain